MLPCRRQLLSQHGQDPALSVYRRLLVCCLFCCDVITLWAFSRVLPSEANNACTAAAEPFRCCSAASSTTHADDTASAARSRGLLLLMHWACCPVTQRHAAREHAHRLQVPCDPSDTLLLMFLGWSSQSCQGAFRRNSSQMSDAAVPVHRFSSFVCMCACACARACLDAGLAWRPLLCAVASGQEVLCLCFGADQC